MSSSSSPTPPSDGRRTILDALSALELVTDMQPSLFDGHAVAELSLSEPLPVYTTGLADLGKLTAAAELTHWRYFLNVPLPTTLLAVVDLAFDGKAWVVAAINRGDLANATADTVAFAQNQPEWRSGAYEPRLLQVPALYTLLVWFHDEAQPTTDVFIPVADPAATFKSRVMVDEATVLAKLQDLATHYQPVSDPS
jgi:hypothetical protein